MTTFGARRKLVFVSAIALASFACADGLRAQVIDVWVRGPDGAPVSGAVITLDITDGTRVSGALTDDRGYARVRAPRAEQYRLAVRRLGFVPARDIVVQISDTAPVRRDVLLEPLTNIPGASLRGVTVNASATCGKAGRDAWAGALRAHLRRAGARFTGDHGCRAGH
jgi:hypothetical protein